MSTDEPAPLGEQDIDMALARKEYEQMLQSYDDTVRTMNEKSRAATAAADLIREYSRRILDLNMDSDLFRNDPTYVNLLEERDKATLEHDKAEQALVKANLVLDKVSDRLTEAKILFLDEKSKKAKIELRRDAVRTDLESVVQQFPSESLPLGSTTKQLSAKRRAQTFVDSLMNAKYEVIPDSNGMEVLRNIMGLETGEESSIVVRSVTPFFWNACIDLVNTPGMRYRVAVIGTPGIGKTKSTALLIRMLLERKKTVVYLIRSEKNNSWHYEFVPNEGDSSIAANVYRENLDESDIPSLRDPSTYYIVDPGKTKNSCDPSDTFVPKVILIASPDERHWGESEFRKRRESVLGAFKIYPPWSLDELLPAREEFKILLTREEIIERYRLFGGVPRNIFTPDANLLDDQDAAILKVSATHAEAIVLGQMDVVGNFAVNAPKGVLLGFNSTREDFGKGQMNVFLLSSAIAEKVYSMHIRTLWNTMISSGEVIQRTLFEPYVRSLLTDSSKKRVIFEMRNQPTKAVMKKKYKLSLPICKAIKLVSDPKEHQLEPFVLFHSLSTRYPLIDCIYTDANGLINAVQITIGNTHSINDNDIKKLHEAYGTASKLNLYYFVPSDRYDTFKTSSIPTYDNSNFCVYVVSVPDPNKTKNAIENSEGQDEDVDHMNTSILPLKERAARKRKRK
jgi:hypothetical protein